MNKFFIFFGLSLLTAIPPSTILGHGNEEHPGSLFAKLKDAVFGSYGDQQPFVELEWVVRSAETFPLT